MQKTITVEKTDAVDAVMALTDGRTAPFQVPKLRGGTFVRVYDTAARGTRYDADSSPDWPGDFVLHAESPATDRRLVRIVATPHGRLANAQSIYVTTAGNTWTDEATVEVYDKEEEETENG